MKKTIFFKSFWINLTVITTVLFLSIHIAGRVFADWYPRNLAREMAKIVTLARPRILAAATSPEILQKELNRLRAELGIRFTLVDADGRVLGDSDQDPQRMDNHLDRPEISAALRNGSGQNLRFSSTEQAPMFYYAVPLPREENQPQAVLRVSLFAQEIDRLIDAFRHRLQLAALLLLLLALLITFLSSRRLAKPVRALAAAARDLASGNFETRVYTRDSGEIGELAGAFNEMAEHQKALIASLSQRQNELKAVMDAMSEGLMLIGQDGDILLYNQAAAAIFPELGGQRRKYWQCCRNPDIDDQIRAGFSQTGLLSRETSLGERHYRINTVPIAAEKRLVMTLHDLTEFRRLERIKKDFITNLSHEIKTPLTTIHGFVETLEEQLDGEALRYLGIIKRNSERLTSLVHDLLLLSRLEDTGVSGRSETVDFKALVAGILPVYEPVAARKGLSLLHSLPQESLWLRGDADRLEDMVVNLLDNAVKYTEQGTVRLELDSENGQAVLEIADSGIGIAAEHLDRIFERFYVVDPSRSKQNGGTGLGLAIVKHIVALHGGSLKVDSQPQKGSRFEVRLPLEKAG